MVDALTDLPRDRPVIDFGAGTGRLTVALARAGFSVLAVDRSTRSLAVLLDIAAELRLDGIRVANALPDEGSYAAIVGADVLHHVDLAATLPVLRALLADDGRIAFSEPGGLNPAWYAWFLATGRLGFERGVTGCTVPALTRSLTRNGFHETRITGFGMLPRSLLGWHAGASRINDRAGAAPGLRWVAYRYLIEAVR